MGATLAVPAAGGPRFPLRASGPAAHRPGGRHLRSLLPVTRRSHAALPDLSAGLRGRDLPRDWRELHAARHHRQDPRLLTGSASGGCVGAGLSPVLPPRMGPAPGRASLCRWRHRRRGAVCRVGVRWPARERPAAGRPGPEPADRGGRARHVGLPRRGDRLSVSSDTSARTAPREMDRLRIALAYDARYPDHHGGAERRYHEIASRLAEKHDVEYITWGHPGDSTAAASAGYRVRAIDTAPPLYGADGKRTVREAVSFAARMLPTLVRG